MIPILMYHSVKRVKKNEVMRSLHVSPTSFKIQMCLLKILGFRGCAVSEAAGMLRQNRNEKVVAITFDDGYQNFKTTVLPILKKYGFTATVYVVTDLIGGQNEWDQGTGISPNQLMTADEIKYCVSQGIEIGCHSSTHARLTDAHVDLNDEIYQSKSILENLTGLPVSAFCYPYGAHDDRVTDFVERCGFSSATTMLRGRATGTHKMLRLPRIPVTWHTLPHLFIIKLLTRYEDKRRNR